MLELTITNKKREQIIYLFKSKAIFDWVSKVTRNCIGLTLFHNVIVPENSRHSFNQSNAKLTPITSWSAAFPALWAVCLFLPWVLIGSPENVPFFWLADVITSVSVLWHSIKKSSKATIRSKLREKTGLGFHFTLFTISRFVTITK